MLPAVTLLSSPLCSSCMYACRASAAAEEVLAAEPSRSSMRTLETTLLRCLACRCRPGVRLAAAAAAGGLAVLLLRHVLLQGALGSMKACMLPGWAAQDGRTGWAQPAESDLNVSDGEASEKEAGGQVF